MSAAGKICYYKRIKANLEIHHLDTSEIRNRRRTMKWAKQMPPAELERCRLELVDVLTRVAKWRENDYHKVPNKWIKAGYRELHTVILQWQSEYAKLKYETALFTKETNDKVRKLAWEAGVHVLYDNGYIGGLRGRGRMLQTVPFYGRDFIKKQHDEYIANLAVQRMLTDEEV